MTTTKKIKILALTTILSPWGHAESVLVFEAATACIPQGTTAGIRYIPPCALSQQPVLPEQRYTLDSDSYLSEGLFKSRLNYHFTCESLRPVSLLYGLYDGALEVERNNVAGTVELVPLHNTMTHQFDSATFRAISLDTSSGFQAMKPGCEMWVDDFLSYPEPAYFELLAESQINLDNVLSNLVTASEPDISYAQALGLIDNGIFLLSFLRAQSDPLTQAQIDLTIEEMQEAKGILAQDCGADSGTVLCSQAIANTRNTLQQESNINEQRLIELRDYLETQVLWLEQQNNDVQVDRESLQSTLESVNQQLEP